MKKVLLAIILGILIISAIGVTNILAGPPTITITRTDPLPPGPPDIPAR